MVAPFSRTAVHSAEFNLYSVQLGNLEIKTDWPIDCLS
jgi:hypothetical protein